MLNLEIVGQGSTTTIYRDGSDAANLCHGDFHPLNILYDGSKHWIID